MVAIPGYDFIGEVKLRNLHEIFKQKNQFIIRTRRRKEPSQVYESSYDEKVVMKLKRKYSGKSVSVDDVLADIDDQKFSINLRYEYGYKRRFEVQDLLVILCGSGFATITKEGRKYIYEVKK